MSLTAQSPLITLCNNKDRKIGSQDNINGYVVIEYVIYNEIAKSVNNFEFFNNLNEKRSLILSSMTAIKTTKRQ